jgi:hypothetical protein
MKFYVTGRSTRMSEVITAIKIIHDLGHEVTFDWPSLSMVKPYDENQNKAAEFAESAVKGIL